MVGSITPVSTSSAAKSPTAAADKAMEVLLKSDAVIEYLVSKTTRWTPPHNLMILTVVWGSLNSSGNSTINKQDVEDAILNAGGTRITAKAFWDQLNPKKSVRIGPKEFFANAYVPAAIAKMSKTVTEAVEQRRLENGPTGSGSVLDFFDA